MESRTYEWYVFNKSVELCVILTIDNIPPELIFRIIGDKTDNFDQFIKVLCRYINQRIFKFDRLQCLSVFHMIIF